MPTPAPYKKLIEVAMPVKEVSAESVRDKSIRHGHISTLHLWWARRPLPVCRAVVFASLVPDPDDENCPPAFRAAVAQLLGPDQNPGDPYKPYDDIPYTAAVDSLPDTLRNRLLMFVGKFSTTFAANEKAGRKTNAKEQLAPASLVRWESKNDPAIIGRARRLIWVAHNVLSTPPPPPPPPHAGNQQVTCEFGPELAALLANYDHHEQALHAAEKALYSYPDRHAPSPEVAQLEADLHAATEAFLDRMPRVFDPFAGGGAIPLEAARLGCRAFGNDINPVAHIIQRASLEFPQRFGKPITYSYAAFVARYGEQEYAKQHAKQHMLDNPAGSIRLANRLAFDVDFYARKVLRNTESMVEQYYPRNQYGQHPIAYYWARVGRCTNPSCRAQVPLLKQFYLKSKPGSEVYLKPIISGTAIQFELKHGICDTPGWMHKSALKCPCCGSLTDAATIRDQVAIGIVTERMLAVIDERPIQRARSIRGNAISVETMEKYYRLPTPDEVRVALEAPVSEMPEARLPNVTRLTGGFIVAWGYTKFGQMFSTRQLFMLNALTTEISKLVASWQENEEEYSRAIQTYLAILVDKAALVNTTFGRWHTSGEKLEHFFSRQAIPMVFDYPESNPFCESTGSLLNQLDWLRLYITEESKNQFAVICNNASSGDISQFPAKSLTAVVTDPPYYDAIAYADLSDFFLRLAAAYAQ